MPPRQKRTSSKDPASQRLSSRGAPSSSRPSEKVQPALLSSPKPTPYPEKRKFFKPTHNALTKKPITVLDQDYESDSISSTDEDAQDEIGSDLADDFEEEELSPCQGKRRFLKPTQDAISAKPILDYDQTDNEDEEGSVGSRQEDVQSDGVDGPADESTAEESASHKRAVQEDTEGSKYSNDACLKDQEDVYRQQSSDQAIKSPAGTASRMGTQALKSPLRSMRLNKHASSKPVAIFAEASRLNSPAGPSMDPPSVQTLGSTYLSRSPDMSPVRPLSSRQLSRSSRTDAMPRLSSLPPRLPLAANATNVPTHSPGMRDPLTLGLAKFGASGRRCSKPKTLPLQRTKRVVYSWRDDSLLGASSQIREEYASDDVQDPASPTIRCSGPGRGSELREGSGEEHRG